MATSALKSTSRRSAAESKANTTARRRSHSVSAIYRKTGGDNVPISSEFSNSRDNPLFWALSSSPLGKEDGDTSEKVTSTNRQFHSPDTRSARNANGSGNSVSEQRGRSVTRAANEKNGIGHSLSRVRGRSVSRTPYRGAYESKVAQDTMASAIARSKNESKKTGSGINRRNSVTRGSANKARVTAIQNQALDGSEDDSVCSFQTSNFEDGFSIGSLSEAEEKTIKLGFQGDNGNSMVSDIRREYTIKLEESEERARKLRANLALEEHRGQELDRILKDMLPDPKTSIHKSCRVRRVSNERKQMSKRLSEEAMAYFDECVSISTFDSSDFSASEDYSRYSSIGGTIPLGASSVVKENPGTSFHYEQGSATHQNQGHSDGSGLTSNTTGAIPGKTQLYEFSFANKKSERNENIMGCIKIFGSSSSDLEETATRGSLYDAGEYNVYSHIESLVMDRVFDNSRIESGGLVLCGGAATSVLPFAAKLMLW